MSERDPIVDFSEFDLNRVIADKEAVQKLIPQRFEMSQLDGILFEDADQTRGVGFKDATQNEFWVRGHMPGFALMPGVLICECAAQVMAYFAKKFKYFDQGMVGFGGINNVRFRGMVRPGDRLVLMVARRRLRRNTMVVCDFEAYVDKNLVAEGELKGVIFSNEAMDGAGAG